MGSKPKEELYHLVCDAIAEGLAVVQEFEAEKKIIKSYDFFPQMVYQDTGFPYFSYASDAPSNYGSIFNDHKSQTDEKKDDGNEYSLLKFWLNMRPPSIPSDSLASWRNFMEFAINDDYLSKYWGPSRIERVWDSLENDEYLESLKIVFRKRRFFAPLRQLLNRYIYITKKKEFDANLFNPIFSEWLPANYLETLSIDIYVPILFQSFTFDILSINNQAEFKKISDDMQLSRNTRTSTKISISKDVIRAATHALVLKNWDIKNYTKEDREELLRDVSAYSQVIAKINKFFAAFRVITGLDVGYSQIIAKPNGWADSWEADLTPVYIVAVKAYPDHFEQYLQIDKPDLLPEETCNQIGELYTLLDQSESNKIELATKRLNNAVLRSDEEDSILDITMGLEALLTQGEKSEITHKLSMRLAALCKIEKFNEYSPNEVFRFCKRIYDYRSAVIHGDSKLKQKRTIQIKEEKVIPTVKLGIELLSFTLKVLAKHPEYLKDSSSLDIYLLTEESELEDSDRSTRNV